jgi:hypothetical protein
MAQKLPQLSSREVIAALERAGFRVIPRRGKGSHKFLYRDEPATGDGATCQSGCPRDAESDHQTGRLEH